MQIVIILLYVHLPYAVSLNLVTVFPTEETEKREFVLDLCTYAVDKRKQISNTIDGYKMD